jgi:hypothetical protein
MRSPTLDTSSSLWRRERWESLFASIYTSIRQRPRSKPIRYTARKELRVLDALDLGQQSVPIYRIIASHGRFNELDRLLLADQNPPSSRSFQPNQRAPIHLGYVGEHYFVLDGNQRVTSAHSRGQLFIPARVTEFVVPEPIDEPAEGVALLIQYELEYFLEHTDLQHMHASTEFETAMLGNLTQLLEHIRRYSQLINLPNIPPISCAQAAERWYQACYLPVLRVARRYGLFQRLQHVSAVDLYLWAVEHRTQIRTGMQPTELTAFRAALKAGLHDLILLGSRLRTLDLRTGD